MWQPSFSKDLPEVAQRSFRNEQLTELTLPVAFTLLEGGIVGVIAAKIFHVPPIVLAVITAAPMLGILGTVVGLIKALNIFAADQTVTDPRLVSPAIGESLITTAAGLVVALVVLFPYNAFRAQIDPVFSSAFWRRVQV